MKQKLMTGMLAIFLCVSFAGAGLALEAGNKRKGKYTYRKIYKACYERGEVDSQKPPVNPDAHTQAAWTELFQVRNFEAFGCSQEWSALNDSDLSDIYSYLHGHASDSPTPAKCK